MSGPDTQPAGAASRLVGLDVFRGLAVAGMILVNNPGSGDHIWWPLDHAPWHGFTPTDLVFPAFLCAVGFALGLSWPRRIDPGGRRALWARLARRSLSLYALGAALALLARPDLAHLRVFGVLQRIAFCYALAAGFALATARPTPDGRHRLSITVVMTSAVAILAIWWVLLALVPVPGFGAGQLTPEGNLAGYVDRTLFTTDHIWRFGRDAAGNIVYDPEGLLSTLGALGNVLLGAAAAIWWRRAGKVGRIAGVSVVLIGLGMALSPILPLNKRLWTSSFALLTSGLSGVVFVGATLIGESRIVTPLRILGANALMAFCISLLIAIAGLHTGLPGEVFDRLDAVIGAPRVSSALYGLLVLAVTFALVVPLDRRGVHLRL